MDEVSCLTLLQQLTKNHPDLFTKYGALIGSLIASSTALFLAAGGSEWLKRKFINPKLKIVGNIMRFTQNHYQWRIAVLNEGNDIAKNVQVDVTEIAENGKPRDNFLPMPLGWTHFGGEVRDILPKQTVFLDVFEHHIRRGDRFGTVNLATRFGGGIDDFRQVRINPEISTLELTFYEQSGKTFKRYIELYFGSELFFEARIKGHKWPFGLRGNEVA